MQDLLRRIRAKFYKWTERKIRIEIDQSVKTERLGSTCGGWIMPENWLNEQSVCYLVGAGEDISFDLALTDKYRVRTWIIDPTPRALEHFQQWLECHQTGQPMPCNTCQGGHYPLYKSGLAENIVFCPVGVWNEDTTLQFFAPRNDNYVSHSLVNLQRSEKHIEVPVKKLNTLMRELGHGHIDFLKIDIEGAEYQVIDSIISDNIPIDILCIEYDETAANHLDPGYMNRIEISLQKLVNAGYRIIAKEAQCHNYTLVHRRRFSS